LLRRLATEFAPAHAPASPAAEAYEAALGEHFSALRDYAAGAGNAAIDRLLVPLPALLLEPTGTRAVELARALRAEAAQAPAPLQAMWTALADTLGAQQRRAMEREIGRDLGEFAQTCRRLTADRFPFDADAKRDMPYADFARLFGPRGLIDAFFRSRLAAHADTRQRPWRALGNDALPEPVQAALRSFEMAADIRRLFFPAGAELPQLRLSLTPSTMDSELLLFSADLDGQLLRYENGPQRAKPIVWPGPAATQRVVLRILPAGPSGVGAEVHDGPWALLRVLQRGGWQRGSGSASSARLEVDGRSLTLNVSAEGGGNAALLGELARFRCPEVR
jgi:type VI secretion system protein ImpL